MTDARDSLFSGAERERVEALRQRSSEAWDARRHRFVACSTDGPTPGSSLLSGRDQAIDLLDDLCEDALELSLDRVLAMSSRDLARSNIAFKYKWLHDLIMDMAHELADADFSRDLQFKAANLNRE